MLGSNVLKAEHSRVKAAFKQVSLAAAPPTEHISSLPSDPKFLEANFRDTYNVAFAEADAHPPVICPFPLTAVNQISSLWKCRGQGSNFHFGVAAAQPQGFAQFALPPTGMCGAGQRAPALQMQALTSGPPRQGMNWNCVDRALGDYEMVLRSPTQPSREADASASAEPNAAAQRDLALLTTPNN